MAAIIFSDFEDSDPDDLAFAMPNVSKLLEDVELSISTQQLQAYDQAITDTGGTANCGITVDGHGSRRRKVLERRKRGTGRQPTSRAQLIRERLGLLPKRSVLKDSDGLDNIEAFWASDEENERAIPRPPVLLERGKSGSQELTDHSVSKRAANGKSRKSWTRVRQRKGTGRSVKKRQFGVDLSQNTSSLHEWDLEELEEESESVPAMSFYRPQPFGAPAVANLDLATSQEHQLPIDDKDGHSSDSGGLHQDEGEQRVDFEKGIQETVQGLQKTKNKELSEESMEMSTQTIYPQETGGNGSFHSWLSPRKISSEVPPGTAEQVVCTQIGSTKLTVFGLINKARNKRKAQKSMENASQSQEYRSEEEPQKNCETSESLFALGQDNKEDPQVVSTDKCRPEATGESRNSRADAEICQFTVSQDHDNFVNENVADVGFPNVAVDSLGSVAVISQHGGQSLQNGRRNGRHVQNANYQMDLMNDPASNEQQPEPSIAEKKKNPTAKRQKKSSSNVRRQKEQSNSSEQIISHLMTYKAPLPMDDNEPRSSPFQKRSNRRKQKTRQSLAGAGTSWEDGVRRSTRRHVRPLEFWRNEKMIYGRNHMSLPTFEHVVMAIPDPLWPLPSGKKKPQRRLLSPRKLPLLI